MRYALTKYSLLMFIAMSFAANVSAEERSAAIESWDFDVYLDDKKVGKHTFSVTESGDLTQVTSAATFKVKFLFITAYQYRHTAAETWVNNCLVDIDASTNANGERIEVSGQQTRKGFLLADDPATLPRCVMTFAYWNAAFLDEPRLLNPQTGEYVAIRVARVGDEMLRVRGERVAATRFELTARDIDLTLWYSPDNEWLALESVAKGGRTIRYELS